MVSKVKTPLQIWGNTKTRIFHKEPPDRTLVLPGGFLFVIKNVPFWYFSLVHLILKEIVQFLMIDRRIRKG